jgi:hypothetical protein
VESVEDVLTRYFPAGYDAEGNINALWTPEFSGVDAPTWHEHFLSDISWWNVYLTQPDAGDTALKDLPARAGSGILFRFNRDSDRDGYNDRAEFRYYCALPQSHEDSQYCADGHLRPEIHPQPELLAGYVVERNGDVVTVMLALENTGTFDAYGIDAVIYSPDETTTIGNNTVGGNGRVRPGSSVVVGSMIKQPSLQNWGNSTSKPYAAGQFNGTQDLTFTFSAETPGVVGTGSTAIRWNDGAGNSAVLDLGSNYYAPLPLDVAHGVQIGFNTGTVDAGASFTMTALTPRDTFTFTVNSDTFTPPVVVVSYSHPQGSTRFVTPVELPWLGDSLAPHSGQMLEGVGLQIVSEDLLKVDGTNTTHLVVNSPHPSTIEDGHLHLNFISDGKLVLEQSHTLDIPAGPTTFSAQWSVSDFSADYNPDGDNLLIAFWTDSENNIIDSTARPFASFAADPRPAADSDATNWDFGAVTQGEVLHRTVSLASVGDLDLLGYVTGSPGLSVSQTGSKPLNLGDLATYDLTLDTRVLSAGPYTGTVTLRTSDPTHPLYTIGVTGVIEPLNGDAYARPVVDRPLDVEVWVAGERTTGEWITFTHPLGSQPENLHPVKVLDANGATLGVGKYATDFGQGTASYDMFGDGRDGVMPSSGNLDNDNGFGAGIINSGSAGSRNISITDAYGIGRINPGDAVLLHQTQGTGSGCWEVNRALSDFGGGTADYELVNPLKCNYSSGGNQRAQILRVPQYSTCNVTGTVTPLARWNGTWGGIFAVACLDTLAVSGAIDTSGFGFRGGASVSAPCADRCAGPSGFQGESFNGIGGQSPVPNNGGGGAGGGDAWGNGQGGASGGGGGYATNGGGGNRGEGGNASPGGGGNVYGIADLSTEIHLGSGGGSGGSDDLRGLISGSGGSGGGILIALARSVQISGAVVAGGTSGGNSNSPFSGPGGGGSGGSIVIVGQNVLNQGTVQSIGGSGVCREYGCSGNGGIGRIRIEYCETPPTGSTNPLASTQKLTCYITEQSTPTTGRLSLPTLTELKRDYQISYAYKLDFAVADEGTAMLGVPAGEWTSATLDALVSGVGTGELTARIDVGNNGVWDWEATQLVTNTYAFEGIQLADAFKLYLAETGDRDVEVKVYLSKPGQVLLTNMVIERNESIDVKPNFALSGTPTEGAAVPLNATVTNSGAADSGPLTVSYYATHHALRTTQTYLGSTFIPNIPAGQSVPASFDWDTLGFTGPVTVTTSVDPYNRLAESDETNNSHTANLTILTRPDLEIANVTLSDEEPLVGETVTVTVDLKNYGQTAAGEQKLVLYRGNPDGGGSQIRVQNVSTLNGGANRNVALTWTPTAPGLYRLFLRGDQENQVNEYDESNNDRWLDVYVGMASPLNVDSGGAGDTAYSAAQGFGVIDSGDPDAIESCGSAPHETFRRDPSGKVVYRFDHLLPGHFYHLDLVLYECGQNAGRQQRVSVDGIEIAGPVDLGGNEIKNLSLLLDPALYADRSIEVAVSVDGTGGALVNQIALVDVDYRYADAGGVRDVRYPSGARPYGWLDGVSQTPWGTLPFQSLRENQSGNEMRYRFDALDPDKNYQVHFNFFLGSGNNRVQQIWVDDVIPLSGDFTLIAGQRNSQRVDLPRESYADGTITVAVRRSDGATTGAMINEIALEEVTQARTSTCKVTSTPSWTVAFGNVTVAGQPAAQGTVVTAENPRGDVVGCYVVNNTGQYGFMSVFGEDASGDPVIPGMKAGEPVIFRVNGVIAVPTPLLTWQDNKTRTRIDLAAGITESQYLLLRPNWNLLSTRMTPPVPLLSIVFQSIAEKYCQVLGPRGIYDCTVPASFQSLKEIAPGNAYYTKINGGSSVNMVIEGVPLPADSPIPLERGLNWVGYLPSSRLPIATALDSISAQLVQVADGQGQIYDPAEPGFSNLLEMTPGHGYLIHLSNAATLVYPSTGAAQVNEPAATEEMAGTGSVHCAGVEPTPYFTAIYGRISINGVEAAVGDRVEVLTPRGEVAGCFTVTTEGQYGFLSVFGADNAAGGLPGFVNDEPMMLQVNGTVVRLDEPLLWRDDKSTHRLDLDIVTADSIEIYLPFTTR